MNMIVTQRRTRMSLTAFTALVALVVSINANAQEESAPRLMVRDTWTYVLSDLFTGLAKSTESSRVEAVTAEGYRLQSTESGAEQSQELTLDLNLKQQAADAPDDTGQLKFPLTIGKKWRSVTAYQTRTSGRLDVEQEVVGMEKVKVAAGEFEAYKIVGKGQWILTKNTSAVAVSDFVGRLETTIWYAPAAKHIVASEMRSFAKGHVADRSRRELKTFELH